MEINMIVNTAKDMGIIIGIPVLRSLAGWVGHALKDSKVSKLEWKLLLETVIRVGSMGFMAYVGFDLAGIDNAITSGAIAAYFADKVFSAVKK